MLGSSAAGFALIWLAVRVWHAPPPPFVPHAAVVVRLYKWLPYTAAAISMLAVVRSRGGRLGHHLQTLALMALFALCMATGDRQTDAVTLGLWVISGALAWKLPLHEPRLRKGLIIAVTGCLVVFARYLAVPHVFVMLQWLYVCAAFAGNRERSWLDCQRAVSAPYTHPPDQIVSSDHSLRQFWRGVVWTLMAIAATECAWRMLSWRSQFSDVWLGAAFWQLFFWVAQLGYLGVLAGLVMMIGIPLDGPMQNPLRIRNFLDIWKMMNRWRFDFLRRVYIQQFVPMRRGLGGAFPIFVVFLVSGTHHLCYHPWWKLDGRVALTILAEGIEWAVWAIPVVASYLWVAHRTKKRIEDGVRGVVRPPPSWPRRAVTATVCLAFVIVSSGLIRTRVVPRIQAIAHPAGMSGVAPRR